MNKIIVCFGLLACASGFVGNLAAATDGASFRVGAARADITPEPAVLNWVTGKSYGAVLDPLFVHALVLDDGVTKAVVVRWDLVDVSESAREEVRARIGAALKMPPQNILVHASHTHSAPWAPVYRTGFRGKENDSWWTVRFMPPQNEQPPFKRWMERLLAAAEEAARNASDSAAPASMGISRVAIPEFLHNRRPRTPAWGMAEVRPAPAINYNHAEWQPEVAQGGATFGPLDRTLSLVTFRSEATNRAVASLFHAACHAVSIYPSTPAISADWPGATAQSLSATFGGESLFLQGCAGDINPWRRGAVAVKEMAEGLTRKAQLAVRSSVRLTSAPVAVGRETINLPLTPTAKARLGLESVAAEIQVIVCGPLAIVGLPGEPMTEIGQAIREASPFPQTLVLGYSNGNGVHYVGMPAEKARGGYEVGVSGAGTEECGPLIIEAAKRVLREVFERTQPRE